jgi:hypothetical protein
MRTSGVSEDILGGTQRRLIGVREVEEKNIYNKSE